MSLVKLALLGDIHGNYLALQAVLAAATSSGVEKLLVTGDLVGYYYAPLKVVEMLHSWDKYMVRGNHEDMLINARNNPIFLAQISDRYGSGLSLAIEQLGEQQLDELCNLPCKQDLMIDGCRIMLCHGAPWNVDQYIYPDTALDMLERCANQDYDLVVLGHTHYPMLKKIGKTVLVNPGSVGQPRNRQPGACWALFDTEDRTITFHNESYDLTDLVSECKLRHPDLPYLSDVLVRT